MSVVTLSARTDRNITLVWIAAIWTFALLGFGADFARFMHEHPSPPLILDLHGAFSVTWLGLGGIEAAVGRMWPVVRTASLRPGVGDWNRPIAVIASSLEPIRSEAGSST